MLSSSKPDKHEAKLASRIDVLMERVDTLAQTVATTASAIAKKDGEIASLRRDLEARDDAIQALASRAAAPPAGTPAAELDPQDLRSLRNAVAALTKEHAERGGSQERIDALSAKLDTVARRLDALAAAPASSSEPDREAAAKLAALESELTSLRGRVEERAAEPDRHSEELRTMLATLRTQVEALAGLRPGGSDEENERRFAAAEDGIVRLGRRIDALGATVEAATTGLADKEHELAALHRHFTEASTRFEGIVEDIRDALSALPEIGSAGVDDVAARLEHVADRLARFEDVSRETAAALAEGTRTLEQRLELLEQQLATVASEVARARTLWPVALRSLEARLEDVASHARLPEPSVEHADATEQDADEDLLAGLRDSLHAMETVAAEMAKASDVLSTDGEPRVAQDAEAQGDTHLDPPHDAVAAGGATVVPLRSADP